MNNNARNKNTMFAAQTQAFSLTALIDNMNKQYTEYLEKTGADAGPNWTLEKNAGNIETPHPHYRIYFGNFYRTELYNFLAEQKLQPEWKYEGDKRFIVISENNLKQTKASNLDTGHFLFLMHQKISTMVEQTNTASINRLK